jgi:hypothetical protein
VSFLAQNDPLDWDRPHQEKRKRTPSGSLVRADNRERRLFISRNEGAYKAEQEYRTASWIPN